MRHPDGTCTFYGVDVMDVSHTFASQEMNDLGPQGQAYIFREQACLNPHHSLVDRDEVDEVFPGRYDTGRGGRGWGRNISAMTTDEVSGITEVTPDSTQQNSATTNNNRPEAGSRNRSSFGSGAYHE